MENSHGSRSFQQVERKGLGELEKFVSLKQSPLFSFTFAVINVWDLLFFFGQELSDAWMKLLE